MIDIDSRSIKEGILAIMGIYGFFFFGRALFWNNYRAKVAARLAGTSRVQSAVLSLKIKLRGPHGPLVIIVLGLIIINPFLINYEDSIQWKTLVLMGEAFLMFAFSGYLVPPSILLLGTSSLDTAKLFVEIDRRIFPYRTVFLLDQVKSELFKVQKDAVPHFSINNLRVRSSYDWRRTVDLISNNILISPQAQIHISRYLQ